jgi:predicted metal-dependent peptidase
LEVTFLPRPSLSPDRPDGPDTPFRSARAETQEEWQARMAAEVLAVTRSELYLDFRFLSAALSAFSQAEVPDERCRYLATDGRTLCYQPDALIRLYRENPKYLARLLLHTTFHCLFRHLWLRGERDPALWDLACDIAVENTIDSLHRKSVERPLTYVRRRAYEGIAAAGRVVAAAPAYRWLLGQSVGVQKQLAREFAVDDHRLWPKTSENPQNTPAPTPQKSWEKLAKQMQTELELRDKEAGDGAEALEVQVRAANRSRRSYRDFLRRFCVWREEVHLDPDSFDLNFYTYGLSLYGDLPLIEPNETRESKKIEELALVVDTSYSTSGELVRAFLAETYALLKQRENFFHRMVLHIIQADNTVQQDELVTSEADLVRVMDRFELKGGGGTDFRPAFAYVSKLCEEKQFKNLRGLLYFTDGLGTYPARRPPYETAFLFLGDRFDDANVPPWAMKVVLDEAEFTGERARPASPDAHLADDFDAYRDLNNS